MNRKRFYAQVLPLILLAVIFAVFYGRSAFSQKPSGVHQWRRDILDTIVTIKVYERDKKKAEKAADAAFQRMLDLEKTAERHASNGEVNVINRLAKKSPLSTQVSQDLLIMLETALKYAEKTKGAFDPTIGPLVDLWGVGTKNRVPKDKQIDRAKKLVNYRLIKLKGDKLDLPRETGIDLGGVFKGYAVDQAMKILKDRGIKSALVSTVSSTKTMGLKPRKQNWLIGIETPRQNRRSPFTAVLKLPGKWSVSSSGDYQRYFIKGNRRYHHVIDPVSGRPSQGVISATVVTKKSAMEADILSTAVMVLGVRSGLSLIESLPDTEVILVSKTGKVHNSSGFKPLAENQESRIPL